MADHDDIKNQAKEMTSNSNALITNFHPVLGSIALKLEKLETSSTKLAGSLNIISIVAVVVAVLGIGWDIVKTIYF